MQYANLGKSPLKVSRLCVGTMMFADQTPLAEARSILDHALDMGCNFLDTADVYSIGQSEAMLGQLLPSQRHRWVLASKLGNAMSSLPNEGQYSRSWVMRACEGSLARLGTDHLDIYYLHRDYNGMNLEEPLRAIEALLREGKIRYWGVSNFRGWRIAEMALAYDGIVPQIAALARDIDDRADHGARWFSLLSGVKHRAVVSAKRVVDEAVLVAGGSSYFSSAELGRLSRDVTAGLFHPSDPESAHATVASAWLGPVSG